MAYSANNLGAQLFPRNEGPKLLIGVHDKRTGVVRLVPAQHLYQMKSLVKQPRLPLDPPAPDPVRLVGVWSGLVFGVAEGLGLAKPNPSRNADPDPDTDTDTDPNPNPTPGPARGS